MNEAKSVLYLAGALVLLSATLHLLLGIAGIVDPGVLGVDTVVLPVLFVISAIAVYGLVGAFHLGLIAPRKAYSIGGIVMLLFIVAYVDWHILQVMESLFPIETVGLEHAHDHGHTHGHNGDTSAVGELVAVLRADPIAMISKGAELIAALLLIPQAIRMNSAQ